MERASHTFGHARRRFPRRGWVAAISVSVALHLVLLIGSRIPVEEPTTTEPEVVRVSASPRPAAFPTPEPAPDSPLSVDVEPPAPGNRTSSLSSTPEASLSSTIPPTTLTPLRPPLLPLVAGPAGVTRRRTPIDAQRRAIARAESLVNARMASLPGAAPASRGAVALAEGGGVTIRTPWPGFLPADLEDEAWRRDRCQRGKGSGGDKPGESEGRRSQC